jgi:hypothetical protein
LVVVPLTMIPFLIGRRASGKPGPRRSLAVCWAQPWRSFNGYGLFAVMTQTRPEIIVQGSDDGRNWRDYEFKYKPGDLRRAPGFVAPHQPRLDWQMWFAALEGPRANPWFFQFEYCLLQNSPSGPGAAGAEPVSQATAQICARAVV